MKIIIPVIVAIAIMGMMIPMSIASPTPSPHVTIYSTYGTNNEYLFVPVNSSGIQVYPDWHVYLYGSGSFIFSINGTTAVSGVSTGSFNFTYIWNIPAGTYANATLKFQGISYNISDIITGPLSNTTIQSVTVSTSYTGQAQFLTVASGVSGAIVYPNWTVTMQSTQNVSYTVYVNGQQLMAGHMEGNKTINFNVTGSTTTVIIGLGSKVFKFPNEIISSVPISKYYGPKPEPLQYTFAQYEYGIIKAFVASLFAIIVALFTARKYLLEKEKREVVRI